MRGFIHRPALRVRCWERSIAVNSYFNVRLSSIPVLLYYYCGVYACLYSGSSTQLTCWFCVLFAYFSFVMSFMCSMSCSLCIVHVYVSRPTHFLLLHDAYYFPTFSHVLDQIILLIYAKNFLDFTKIGSEYDILLWHPPKWLIY